MYRKGAKELANSVDPDHTVPVRSDLGLLCLPGSVSLKT